MDAFLQDQGFKILAGAIGVILSITIGVFLRPVIEASGKKIGVWLRTLTSPFPRRYRAHLLEHQATMSDRGRITRPAVSLKLESVYVPLRVRARGRLPSTIGQAMQAERRLVILGGPGGGKTTLLRYLVLTYARRLAYDRLELGENLLPIFLSIQELQQALAADKSGGLPQLLATHYAQLSSRLEPPPRFFDTRLSKGRCLVLFDGLDEVADPHQRLELANWIDTQVSIYAGNRFVLTSRPDQYHPAALQADFAHLTLQAFSEGDIEQYCHNWCLATKVDELDKTSQNEQVRREARRAASDLLDAIHQDLRLHELAANPLLLSIMTLVHYYRRESLPQAPASLAGLRARLYEECVDILIGWDDTKGLPGVFTPAERRAVLQRLALELHCGRVEVISTPRLKAQLKEALLAVREQATGQDVNTFMSEVVDRSGLFRRGELRDDYRFSHLTFQEYLAACELAQRGPVSILLEEGCQPWWQEVALFYSTLAGDASSLVESLLGDTGADWPASLLLAGHCLSAATGTIEPHLGEQVKARLVTLFETGSGSPFLEAGQLLAGLEGEGTIARFLRVAAAGDADRRREAKMALADLLASNNHVQRRQYWAQLLETDFGLALSFGKPLLLGYDADLWHQVIVPQLRRVVADGCTRVSQLMVELAASPAPATARVATDCLDELLAEVDGAPLAMARYPVTNAQYARFVDDGGYHNQAWWSEPGWRWRNGKPRYDGQRLDHPDFWDDATWNGRDCPVVGVTWYEAEAYCGWLSSYTGRAHRLPRSWEWQRAAQGVESFAYPWGQSWKYEVCNTEEAGIQRTSPVGNFSPHGDSPIGCADMSGNVWEWCLDGPAGPEGSRVLRGGAWDSNRNSARCTAHFQYHPANGHTTIGFRVVCGQPASEDIEEERRAKPEQR
jgi:hypothetical protein